MKLKDKIELILKDHAGARDSDKMLIVIYISIYHKDCLRRGLDGQDHIALVDFYHLPAFESITRVRRKLQKEGRYNSTKQVEEARRAKESTIHDNINREDWGEYL